jgi:hypothetical protein
MNERLSFTRISNILDGAGAEFSNLIDELLIQVDTLISGFIEF